MAFTFTPEDGTGVTDSNSYVTLSVADAYIGANTHAAENWSQLSETDKKKLLVWATRYIDVRTKWEGSKVYPDAHLSWPREGVIDHEGNAVADDVVPLRVQYAVAEMSRFLMTSDLSAPGIREGIERIRVDVVELYLDGEYRTPTIPTDVILLLRGLGVISNPSGITFGKVVRS